MSNGDAPTADELTARIDRLEHELSKLLSERETALTGWPNEPTIAQGFMAGRWQRRDGDGYTQALAVAGGNVLVIDRSQIVVIDLGPVA